MGSRTVCEHFHEPDRCTECENQKPIYSMILGKKGVTADMEFICNDCNEKIHGGRILEGEYLYIIEKNPRYPHKSTYRCECCQDDVDDREG